MLDFAVKELKQKEFVAFHAVENPASGAVMRKCGFVYEGNEVHTKFDGSPWANPERCAAMIRGDYVAARKPNPSHVAHDTDPALIRREAEETVKAMQKYGCPMDYVLKDITTVSCKPRNLIVWAETVSDVMDVYYGQD